MKIYCDGAASMKLENGKYKRCAGGWAWASVKDDDNICRDNVIETQSGGEDNTTNNRMELYAVYMAILHNEEPLEIYCDSAYVINIFSQWVEGWKRNGWTRGKKHEPIENVELIKEIYNELQNKDVTFYKVKGHSTNLYNNIVDELAVIAKKERTNNE